MPLRLFRYALYSIVNWYQRNPIFMTDKQFHERQEEEQKVYRGERCQIVMPIDELLEEQNNSKAKKLERDV